MPPKKKKPPARRRRPPKRHADDEQPEEQDAPQASGDGDTQTSPTSPSPSPTPEGTDQQGHEEDEEAHQDQQQHDQGDDEQPPGDSHDDASPNAPHTDAPAADDMHTEQQPQQPYDEDHQSDAPQDQHQDESEDNHGEGLGAAAASDEGRDDGGHAHNEPTEPADNEQPNPHQHVPASTDEGAPPSFTGIAADSAHSAWIFVLVHLFGTVLSFAGIAIDPEAASLRQYDLALQLAAQAVTEFWLPRIQNSDIRSLIGGMSATSLATNFCRIIKDMGFANAATLATFGVPRLDPEAAFNYDSAADDELKADHFNYDLSRDVQFQAVIDGMTLNETFNASLLKNLGATRQSPSKELKRRKTSTSDPNEMATAFAQAFKSSSSTAPLPASSSSAPSSAQIRAYDTEHSKKIDSREAPDPSDSMLIDGDDGVTAILSAIMDDTNVNCNNIIDKAVQAGFTEAGNFTGYTRATYLLFSFKSQANISRNLHLAIDAVVMGNLLTHGDNSITLGRLHKAAITWITANLRNLCPPNSPLLNHLSENARRFMLGSHRVAHDSCTFLSLFKGSFAGDIRSIESIEHLSVSLRKLFVNFAFLGHNDALQLASSIEANTRNLADTFGYTDFETVWQKYVRAIVKASLNVNGEDAVGWRSAGSSLGIGIPKISLLARYTKLGDIPTTFTDTDGSPLPAEHSTYLRQYVIECVRAYIALENLGTAHHIQDVARIKRENDTQRKAIAELQKAVSALQPGQNQGRRGPQRLSMSATPSNYGMQAPGGFSGPPSGSSGSGPGSAGWGAGRPRGNGPPQSANLNINSSRAANFNANLGTAAQGNGVATGGPGGISTQLFDVLYKNTPGKPAPILMHCNMKYCLADTLARTCPRYKGWERACPNNRPGGMCGFGHIGQMPKSQSQRAKGPFPPVDPRQLEEILNRFNCPIIPQ